MLEAHLLLQKHGQTLCKNSKPLCRECPLTSVCAFTRVSYSLFENAP